jgi:hypothetical protein
LPAVRFEVHRVNGSVNASLHWRAHPLNMVIGALSATLIGVLLVYFLIENV